MGVTPLVLAYLGRYFHDIVRVATVCGIINCRSPSVNHSFFCYKDQEKMEGFDFVCFSLGAVKPEYFSSFNVSC